jgi:hypothetical protein
MTMTDSDILELYDDDLKDVRKIHTKAKQLRESSAQLGGSSSLDEFRQINEDLTTTSQALDEENRQTIGWLDSLGSADAEVVRATFLRISTKTRGHLDSAEEILQRVRDRFV